MASAFTTLHGSRAGEDRSSQVPWSLRPWGLDKQHKGLQDIRHQGWGCLFPLIPTDAKVFHRWIWTFTPPTPCPPVPDPLGPCRTHTPSNSP